MLESTKKYNTRVDQWTLIGTDTDPGQVDRALNIDSTLATAWLGLVSVMVSAEVDVIGQDANSEVIEFVKETLFKRASRRFADYHSDLLQALLYGVAPFEVTLDFNEGKWWLKDLAFIHPRHFDIQSLKKEPGEWWVTGRCYVNGKPVQIGAPGSGLPVVWWPIYGRGILGSSLMRPVIETHDEKCEVQEQRRLALQKSIQGSLVALCGEPTQMMDELSQDELEVVATNLAHCADGTDNACALPPQVKQVLPVYPATDSIDKTIAAEDHCDLTMLSAFGSLTTARGILTGYGSQGAAVGDSQAQQALRSYFFQWAARQFQDIMDWLVDINFGVQNYYPELSIISPAPQTPESLVRATVQLASSGAIRYRESDEAYFRRLLRLPKPEGAELNIKELNDRDDSIGLDNRDRTDEFAAAKDERSNLA